MGTQCEFLDTEPLAATESSAIVPLQGEWRYALGGTLLMLGALGLLAVLADEALGGAVTEVLVASVGSPGIFSR